MSTNADTHEVKRRRLLSLLRSHNRGGRVTKARFAIQALGQEPKPVTLPRVKWLERPDP